MSAKNPVPFQTFKLSLLGISLNGKTVHKYRTIAANKGND